MGRNRGFQGSRGGRTGGGGGGSGGRAGGNSFTAKWCKFCKKEGGHDSNFCYNNPANRNKNNNRVEKNHKYGKKSQKQIYHQIERPINDDQRLCVRCGITGHSQKECYQKPVPQSEQCGCGCEYHRGVHCPWKQDQIIRMEAQAQATGKICQWCKDSGDGTHVYAQCRGPVDFRAQTLRNIVTLYDKLDWCWHCSAQDHRTGACDQNNASVICKDKWNVAISRIVENWIKHNPYMQGSRFCDVHIFATSAPTAHRPPMSSDLKWCIVCEEFGHLESESLDGSCDYTQWNERAPIQLRYDSNFPKNNGDVIMKGARWSTTHQGGIKDISVGAHVFNNCTRCLSSIGPWVIPRPPSGQIICCPKCNTPNSHPHTLPCQHISCPSCNAQQCQKPVVPYTSTQEIPRKLTKKEIIDAMNVPFHKRPSMALPNRLAIPRWPEVQPFYDDRMDEKGKSPVFNTAMDKDGLTYFNRRTNDQLYFPATKFAISADMKAIAIDTNAMINRAGIMGMYMMCITCNTRGLVSDDENDIVMCGTEGMNTVGAGRGKFYAWIDESGGPRHSCKCLMIIGQKQEIAWVQN